MKLKKDAIKNNVFVELTLKSNEKITGKAVFGNSNVVSILENGRGSPKIIPYSEIKEFRIIK